MKIFSKNIISAVLIFFVLIGFYLLFTGQARKTEEVSLSHLVSQINGGEVSKIIVRDQELEIILKNGGAERSKKERETTLLDSLFN